MKDLFKTNNKIFLTILFLHASMTLATNLETKNMETYECILLLTSLDPDNSEIQKSTEVQNCQALIEQAFSDFSIPEIKSDIEKEPINYKEGIAPGLGAWGYFAKSKSELTPELIETEKWYAVVQTLYLPDWNTRQPYLRNWYKYRKVVIVNTKNGNAVVAAIADAGPAAWTGKHFGGSPEVMEYLGGPRYKKGPVVLFFVDDPENKVPLGPIEYNKINLPEGSLVQI